MSPTDLLALIVGGALLVTGLVGLVWLKWHK